MTGTDTLSLDGISLLLVWTAIATYLLAFIAYTIDLAQRSVPASTPQREPALVGATATVSPHWSARARTPGEGDLCPSRRGTCGCRRRNGHDSCGRGSERR